MRIEVANVNLVGSWLWDRPRNPKLAELTENGTDVNQQDEDDEEDVCGICRNRFDGTCPSCEYPGDTCPIVLGSCHHDFHVHCIKQWLSTETSKGLCPLCRQGFQLKPDTLINKPHYEEFRSLLMSVRQHNIPMGDDDQDMIEDGFIR